MVHHQLHALRVRIFVECLEVEVGIRRNEVEDVILRVPEPVLPTDVPAFDQYLIEAVLRGKVDVAAHLFVVGRMRAVRLHFRIVRDAEVHRRQVVGISPRGFPRNHFPPYPDVFHRTNPRHIVELARFVQIQRQMRGEDTACVVADDHCTPRRVTRGLHISFFPLRIRRQPRLKRQRLIVEIERHARVVDKSSLMQVDVKPVIGLHHQRRLHARR